MTDDRRKQIARLTLILSATDVNPFRVRWNAESVLFTSLVAIHLVPLWAFKYFPTQDGPLHVENAAVLYDYCGPAHGVLREYYRLNLRFVPNWLSAAALFGLMHVAPTITAEKLLIAGYVILLPLSIRYTLRAINEASTFLALLAFPLIYNEFLHRGFYNFLFSIPICFLIIGYWLRHRDGFRLRELLSFVSLSIVLYFCHIVAFVSFVVTLVIITVSLTMPVLIRNYGSARGGLEGTRLTLRNPLLVPLWGLLPALVLAAVFVLQQRSLPSWSGYSWKLVIWPLYGIVAITNNPPQLLLSMCVFVLFVLILCHSVSRRAARDKFLGSGFLLATATSCILYFAAPESMAGGTIINQRFMVFTLLLLILWFGTQIFSPREKYYIGAAAIGLATLQIAFNLPVYAGINRAASEYLAEMAVVEPNSTLLALCLAREGCGVDRGTGYLRVSPFQHLSGYLAAQDHLVDLSNSSAQTNYFPIRYRDERDPSFYLRDQIEGKRTWAANIADYTRQTGGRIDYVLLWGMSDAWQNGESTGSLEKWLIEEYHHIFTSPQRGMLQIYRRKDFKR